MNQHTGFFNGSKTSRGRDRMNSKLSWSSWDSSTSPLMSPSHVPWVFITKFGLSKGAVIKKMNMRCDSTLETWEIIRKIMKIQKKSVTSSLGSATKYLATFSRRSEVSTRYVTCLLGSCTDTPHTHTHCLLGSYKAGMKLGCSCCCCGFDPLLCYWKSTMVFNFKIMFNFIFSIQSYYTWVWNDELYLRICICLLYNRLKCYWILIFNIEHIIIYIFNFTNRWELWSFFS